VYKGNRITVIIPCLNEETTIAKVVGDFKRVLPSAETIVFDNGSTDRTAQFAAQAGAEVITEKRRGKGFVVQAMFQKVEANIYVMVDGDDTYPAGRLGALLEPVLRGEADMSIGSRTMLESNSEFKLLHRIGNRFFQGVLSWVFGSHLTDILSGYRCMSRRLVKSLPLFAKGFEIEAEITIKSLQRGFSLVEVPVDLTSRAEGSYSKIRVLRDGLRILGTIFSLFRDYKPLTFFGSVGLGLVATGLVPAAYAFLSDRQVVQALRFSLEILSLGLVLIGIMFIAVGLILHTVDRRFQELEHFLRVPDRQFKEDHE